MSAFGNFIFGLTRVIATVFPVFVIIGGATALYTLVGFVRGIYGDIRRGSGK